MTGLWGRGAENPEARVFHTTGCNKERPWMDDKIGGGRELLKRECFMGLCTGGCTEQFSSAPRCHLALALTSNARSRNTTSGSLPSQACPPSCTQQQGVIKECWAQQQAGSHKHKAHSAASHQGACHHRPACLPACTQQQRTKKGCCACRHPDSLIVASVQHKGGGNGNNGHARARHSARF
eukprot:1160961-Pelagomonas_calceolata.AAC.8